MSLPALLRAALFLGVLLLPGCARAAEIEGLETRIEEDQLYLSFRLSGAFDDRLLARVQSGLPTELRYRIELLRDRKRWFDAALDEETLTVVAMYDALRREYLVNAKLDGKLLESRTVHELAKLEEAMTRIESLAAFTLPQKAENPRLLVRVRAEMGTRQILGFIPSKIGRAHV